jgi:transcriptional regulator with GAF, ATPase, and Fis domain
MTVGGLIGQSAAMRDLYAAIERVAPLQATALIQGETGSGKELVAAALHGHSRRAAGPFVVFDCSAVSKSLVESELFGHQKGAFTGAIADRAGAFERACGGTLFLDEIGELPLEIQPKLLRALEQRQIRRLGSNTTRAVDVRIIAATHRSLAAEVEAGRFRQDLYYRLDVFRVAVPPLRERHGDIPLLVQHFHRDLVGQGRASDPLPPLEIFRSMEAWSWPGNVRELRNAVEVALTTGNTSQLPSTPRLQSRVDLSVPLRTALDEYTLAYVVEALKATGGNVSRAAAIARCNRKVIQATMRRHNLR